MTDEIVVTVNGLKAKVAIDPETPLLWFLRDELGLTGTKYGCGIAHCGACTVQVDGEAVRSCVTPIKRVAGQRVVTIEGLAKDRSHPVQQAWLAEQVPQCGYCQAGQIMSTVCLLRAIPNPTDDDINAALAGNICRCGTYVRIRKAVHHAAQLMALTGANHHDEG